MENYTKLSKKQIKAIYKQISQFHKKYLSKLGVKLPKLMDAEKMFTRDSLVLVYLANGYPKTRKITKEELTKFVRSYYPNTNDVQQARHLGAQAGWWIVAGGRDNIVLKVERGSYQLHTLEEPYPGFMKGHRVTDTNDWGKIKEIYHFRCATCGSREGQPHFHWPATKTILQKSHMNPSRPLVAGNIIPQCQKCNRGDRNRWVYDPKGRVIQVANPEVIMSCDKEIRKRIFEILSREFRDK